MVFAEKESGETAVSALATVGVTNPRAAMRAAAPAAKAVVLPLIE
jgi:hypothetical protein